VIGPAIQRLKTLLTTAGTAAAVENPVHTGVVPRHTNKEGTIVTIVSGPPGLRGGQYFLDIGFYRGQIQFLEFGGVIKIRTVRIGFGTVLAEWLQIQLFRPPVVVAVWHGMRSGSHEGHGHHGS